MDYISLSKELSYALRHKPQEYNLILDDDGFTYIDDLLKGINSKHKYPKEITIDDIYEVIKISDKKRLEINNNMIRAFYGHSISKVIHKTKIIPSEFLYHGTSHKVIDKILKEGLKPMSRQYVHLSSDEDTAMMVGKRRDNNPIILKVNSLKAHTDGINFYEGNDNVILADHIPSKYLVLIKE